MSKKREYFRICPFCGRRFNQKHMIRTNLSDTGWLCEDCYGDVTLDVRVLNELEEW